MVTSSSSREHVSVAFYLMRPFNPGIKFELPSALAPGLPG
jgi:hypothetical protein